MGLEVGPAEVGLLVGLVVVGLVGLAVGLRVLPVLNVTIAGAPFGEFANWNAPLLVMRLLKIVTFKGLGKTAES